MTLRLAALALALTALAPAQELLFLGPRLDDLWAGTETTLWVQSGRRLIGYQEKGGRIVATRGRPGARSPFGEALARTEFFDVRGAAVFVDRKRCWRDGGGESHALEPALRRPLGGMPQRLPLVLDDARWLAPARSEALLFGAGSEVVRVPAATGGASELGWGIGDELVIRESIPHYLPVDLAATRRGLLVGSGPDFTLHTGESMGERIAVTPPSLDDEEGVLDFPYEIAPLVADLDADGADELLLADPSAGAVFYYGDLENPVVTHVLLAGGQLLSMSAEDLDRDGRPDLALLRVPSLGVMAQLAVLTEGRLGVELLVYRGEASAGKVPFGRSPAWRHAFDLPLRVSVENRVRQAHFPALAIALPGPALFVARPEEPATLTPLGDEGGERRELAVLPAGRALRPFSAARLGAGLRAFGWSTPNDGRVYSISID